MRSILLMLLLVAVVGVSNTEQESKEIDYKQIAKEAAEKVNKKYEGTDEDPKVIVEDVEKMVEEQLILLGGGNAGDCKLEKDIETREEQDEKKWRSITKKR